MAANQIIEFDNQNTFDFVFTENLPIGIAPYFIRTDALAVAVHMKENSDTEIWGPFVNQPNFFIIGFMNVTNNTLPSNLRITCDYPEDYELIKTLFQNFQTDLPDLTDIICLYETMRDIFSLNKGITQRMPDVETINMINNQFESNKVEGLRFASKHNIILNPEVINKNTSI
jgi:spore coat polysaccharide biosynthesis protein SpsF